MRCSGHLVLQTQRTLVLKMPQFNILVGEHNFGRSAFISTRSLNLIIKEPFRDVCKYNCKVLVGWEWEVGVWQAQRVLITILCTET